MKSTPTSNHPFRRLKPVGRILNLMKEGWSVWDCSPIYGPDGRVHVFFTRWRNRSLTESPDTAWYHKSEIVHAVAERAEGPYEIREVVLQPPGNSPRWDGSSVINAKIYRFDDSYALLYTGCTAERHDTQCIGLLVSQSLDGPWTRVSDSSPLLAPEPGRRGFDGHLCNNPCLLRHPNGQFWLYYKGRDVARYENGRSVAGGMRIGLAIAERLEGPYYKFAGNPVISFAPGMFEDPYVWLQDGKFYMLASDISVIGHHRGLWFESDDGLRWSKPAPGYPSSEELLDRSQRLEEPNVLFRDHRPEYLFNVLGACAEDPVCSGFVSKIGGKE